MSNLHTLAAGIVSTVLLVGCSHVGGDSAESKLAWAAVSKAGDVYVTCVVATATHHATTDGNDVAPGDIADATVAQCSQYLSAVEAAYYAIPLHSSQAREWMLGHVPQEMAKMTQEARGQAIDVVLRVRAAGSSPSTTSQNSSDARTPSRSATDQTSFSGLRPCTAQDHQIAELAKRNGYQVASDCQ